MKKNKIRDIIYVSASDIDKKCFVSYGIEFIEFMTSIDNRPENLILLKHDFNNAVWNQNSRFDYVTSLELDELLDDNVYRYGDFCWVDIDSVEAIDKLTEIQIAELLFFGHLAKPLNEIPKARFAYYAHDDGWFNKLYITNLEDYKMILSKTLISKLNKITRKSFSKLPNDISNILLESTLEGLFIDLSKIKKENKEIQIPITTIGHFRDMDNVYKLKDEITEYKGWLVYSQKSWKLIQEG